MSKYHTHQENVMTRFVISCDLTRPS